MGNNWNWTAAALYLCLYERTANDAQKGIPSMSLSLKVPPDQQLHASAIQFLIDGGDEEAASILLSCNPTCAYRHDSFVGIAVDITLRTPRPVYLFLKTAMDARDTRSDCWKVDAPSEEKILSLIEDAFRAVLPGGIGLGHIEARAALIEINPEWREEFIDALRGTDIHNQGIPLSQEKLLHPWNNLRFRSQTEIRIAEALERAQVLFFPNCMARLGFSRRQNREPDFLICHKGKWGILEVDSPLSHPPSRAIYDYERDRLFQAHGILLVQHFDAGECWENADGVVEKFLYLLRTQK
jgi:hypothetical protein